MGEFMTSFSNSAASSIALEFLRGMNFALFFADSVLASQTGSKQLSFTSVNDQLLQVPTPGVLSGLRLLAFQTSNERCDK